MSVGLLLITHNHIGEDLLHTARTMLGGMPLSTAALAILQTSDPETFYTQATELCEQLDTGDGVLVFTDIYGSTPSNIATRLLARGNIELIAGINLPMLVRVLNYPALSLAELVAKALSGGHDGILLSTDESSHSST